MSFNIVRFLLVLFLIGWLASLPFRVVEYGTGGRVPLYYIYITSWVRVKTFLFRGPFWTYRPLRIFPIVLSCLIVPLDCLWVIGLLIRSKYSKTSFKDGPGPALDADILAADIPLEVHNPEPEAAESS